MGKRVPVGCNRGLCGRRRSESAVGRMRWDRGWKGGGTVVRAGRRTRAVVAERVRTRDEKGDRGDWALGIAREHGLGDPLRSERTREPRGTPDRGWQRERVALPGTTSALTGKARVGTVACVVGERRGQRARSTLMLRTPWRCRRGRRSARLARWMRWPRVHEAGNHGHVMARVEAPRAV